MAGGLSAEAGPTAGEDMTVLKHTTIVVRVEEALSDLLVVSYRPKDDDILYQGVLLHSNKRNLPYGVNDLHPAFLEQNKMLVEEDRLHSVSQRFAYTDKDYVPPCAAAVKQKPRARQRMTVRLRPRKVLCSNCQGICNENSESVDSDRKRKAPRAKTEQETILMGNSLIPKLSRLQPSEITNAINGSYSKMSAGVQNKSDPEISETMRPEITMVDVSSVFDDKKEDETSNFNPMFSSARTLKICFGAGEGTVVKLPANVGDFNEDSGVSSDIGKTVVDSKAAKRAMKKAKKQAKKNIIPTASPIVSPVTSPRHIGALSPRNNVTSNTPTVINDLHKRHRHKVKHKKKRRVERERDENNTKQDLSDTDNSQKLTISLKRLRYSRRPSESGSEAGEEGVPEFPTSTSFDNVGGAMGSCSSGEVVWGKLAGFPWWPGRVLDVTAGVAHVSWYASTTCSHIPTSSMSSFLEDYKHSDSITSANAGPINKNVFRHVLPQAYDREQIRFNKKKRGAYKEAVRLAMADARRREQPQDPLGGASPSILSTLSPRPIDVSS